MSNFPSVPPEDLALQVRAQASSVPPASVFKADHHSASADKFARINECTPEEVEVLAHILELRGAQPRQVKIRQVCLEAAGVGAGMSVIDLGCGTGVVTRQVARMVGRDGRVVGLDASEPLLSYARKQVVPGGARIEYIAGDALRPPQLERRFDVSLAVTLLSHLPDPGELIEVMKSLTRPQGMVAIFDQDYETLLFEHSDRRLTRRILAHGAERGVLDACCGRSLPGILVRHGLRAVRCWPFVYTERDAHSYLITIATRFAALATANDIVAPETAKRWLDELHARDADGSFLGSINYYFAMGRLA